ncbi:hypothetical protein Pcaca04_40580 [Pectobacterium carotovorum subsp. carotovorum]|nr:hypothetical protein Pcaca04_40580 [Pectobacterium carotovorum subsp. carotovorum]
MPSAVYKSLTVTNTYDDNVIDTIMLLGRVANRLNSVKKGGLFMPCMTGLSKGPVESSTNHSYKWCNETADL